VKDVISAWLVRLPAEPGIQACTVRSPDAECYSRTFSERITSDQVDAMWQPLFETLKAFNVRRLPVSRLACKYERHAVQVCIRPDGWILGILMSRELAEARPACLQNWTGLFLSLSDAHAA